MINIDIVSDVVCPWCFIGTRRLAAAMVEVRRDFPDLLIKPRWRPFFLNPDTPPQGEPYLPFLVRKFGSRERVESLWGQIAAAGRVYGLDYHFEKIQVRANTLNAHRLIHWAQERGDATALVERLFVAQFQHGLNVGASDVLVQVAADSGFASDEVRAYLVSGQDVDLVRAMEREARQMGVRAVPTFVVANREVIAGAEDPAVLAAAVRRCLPAA